MSTFPRCSPSPPPPPRRQFLDPRIHIQFYNLTYNVYVHLPFSLELEWKRIRLLAYQSCWLSFKRHPYILRNAHFITRMRISLNVSFFHGRRFLRYTGQYYLVSYALQRHVRQTMQYVVLLTRVDMHLGQSEEIYRLYNNFHYLMSLPRKRMCVCVCLCVSIVHFICHLPDESRTRISFTSFASIRMDLSPSFAVCSSIISFKGLMIRALVSFNLGSNSNTKDFP